MAGWDRLRELVRLEIVQRMEEGCDIEGFDEKLAEADEDEERLMRVYEELIGLGVRDDYPFEEPSDLESIRRLRPDGPRRMDAGWSEPEWLDKFYGAWLGRCAGCVLGKPLEHADYLYGKDGRPGWANVELWFRGADAWPIRGYTPARSRAESEYGLALNDWSPMSVRETIRYAESDDDIRYTVLGLLLLEEKGLDWDSWDVGKLWHRHLTYSQVCTAETQAYMNFARETSHLNGGKTADWPVRGERVRMYLNPYREWIGAQIRADGLAYGAAGHPELAAELGWRDASFSHVKNGVYGEMFAAAMIAAAFAERDSGRIVEIGLSEIPATSRLAKAVREAVDIARRAKDERELASALWDAFGQYDAVHAINNAALVAASLVFAGDDFEKAIAMAVYGGWDTDCNGATVGSVMGAKLGASALPKAWIEPLGDTLYAEVHGFHPIAISACARRSYEVFRKLRPRLPE